MKRILALVMTMLLVMGFAACGSSNEESALSESSVTTEESADSEEPTADDVAEDSAHADTLVVYFSATGTTKGVAEKIAAVEGADLYEIKAAQEYTDADLDWNDEDSRTTYEQNDPDARPEIGSDSISLDGYTTIYIGYPIWWGEEPRIIDTFVESYDFDGITMIPFCTSGGSGIGRSGQNLADHAGSGTWLDGDRLNSGISEDEIRTWIDGMK